MQKIKRLTALLLTGSLMLTLLPGCSNKKETSTSKQEEKVVKMGVLARSGISEKDYNEKIANISTKVAGENATPKEVTFFNSLNDMLTALEDGKIDIASTSQVTADYITASNQNFAIVSSDGLFSVSNVGLAFCMATTKENQEIYDMVNKTIKECKEDGTLDKLIDNELKAYVDGEEPKTHELPKFEGAKTITVAITGDFPTMDMIKEDGNPAGFNMAFLSAISEKIQMNIEITQIKANERMDALSSGQADIAFWCIASEVKDDNGESQYNSNDLSEDVLLTEPYFTDTQVFLKTATSK